MAKSRKVIWPRMYIDAHSGLIVLVSNLRIRFNLLVCEDQRRIREGFSDKIPKEYRMRLPRSRGPRDFSFQTLENRVLLSGDGGPRVLAPAYAEIIGEPIVIGTSKLIDITFTASNDQKTTISVKGAQAAITFGGTNVPLLANGHGYFPNGAVETVESILITDAVPGKASISEVCAYSATPGTFNVGSITGGDLGSINFPNVNLTGSLSLDSVKHVTLDAVSGAVINVTKSVSVANITGTLNGTLTAGSMASLTAHELNQATVTTTAVYNRHALGIGSITAPGGIEESSIISAGNIGSVTAGFVQGSVISASAVLTANTPGDYPADLVPASSHDFTAAASIRSIRILPGATGGFFSNSVIAAETIGTASIGQITGGGGLAADAFGTVAAIGPSGELDSITFHLGPKDLHTSTTLRAALTRLGVPYTASGDDTLFYDFELNVL